MADIEIHSVDDWVAVYIDGNLKYSDHSIRGRDMLDILDIQYNSYFHEGDAIEQYAMAGMGFPNTLEELEAIDDEVIEGLL